MPEIWHPPRKRADRLSKSDINNVDIGAGGFQKPIEGDLTTCDGGSAI